MEPHEQIRLTRKKYGSLAMFTAIVVGLVLILAGQPSLGKGFVLGTIFSVLNFVAMGLSLPYRIGMPRNKATAAAGFSILVRYALLAVPLVMAINMDQFNLTSTICGLFTIQFLILAEYILRLFIPANPKRVDS